MRPNTNSRDIRLRTLKPRQWTTLIAGLCAAFLVASADDASTCMAIAPDKSAEVPLSLGSTPQAMVTMSYFENSENEQGDTQARCSASAYLPLSAFPSTSNRFGTSAIAATIREQVDEWGMSECNVVVMYENDTGVDMAEYELCTYAEYGFDKGSVWTKESENYCWMPED